MLQVAGGIENDLQLQVTFRRPIGFSFVRFVTCMHEWSVRCKLNGLCYVAIMSFVCVLSLVYTDMTNCIM